MWQQKEGRSGKKNNASKKKGGTIKNKKQSPPKKKHPKHPLGNKEKGKVNSNSEEKAQWEP